MNRLIKWITIVFAGLVLLMVLATVLLPKFIDPNDYRSDIAKMAYEQTGLTLKINGPIDWSVFPWLGLNLKDLTVAGHDGSQLAKLEKADVSVKLLPLLTKNIEVKNATLDGLNLNLVKNQQGKGNWEVTSAKPSPPARTPPAKAPVPQATATSAPAAGTPMALDIANVAINNLTIQYSDKTTGNSYVIKNASLNTSAISNQTPFDITAKASVLSNNPKISLNTELKATVTFNLEKGLYDLNNFSLIAKPDAEPLTLTGNIHLQQQPFLTKGEFNIASFNPKQFLAQLNMPLPPMADKNAMESLTVKGSFKSNGKSLNTDNLALTLDDFNLNGFLNVDDIAKEAITFKLTGNALNLDNYLPPATSTPVAVKDQDQAPSAEPNTPEKELPLIPEALLSNLNINGSMSLTALTAANLQFDQPSITIHAADGRSEVKIASGFYKGTIELDGKTDVRVKGTPKLAVKATLKDISLNALSTPITELKPMQGDVNANMNIATEGQLQSALTRNLNGTIGFDINQGAFKEANFNKMVCEGIALVRQEKLQKKDWGTSTPFEDLSGTFTIRNGVAVNKDLTAALSSLNLKGDGTINFIDQTIDYHVGLNIRGDEQLLDNDPACEINKDYVNITWPVRCLGKLGAQQCGLDSERMANTIADLAKQEAKKHIKNTIDKKVNGLKDAFKGLFN
ncbi:AsmA family protein [Candidatus Sororendozoicomonas aggregata]|uniref:AsmA family protein n=1 Tax=Candidatus Sororendozoicomonas aggregata TaxID=3073239 RepID=UPI002ECFFB92